MEATLLASFTLSGWFMDVWTELTRWFSTMNTTQWGIVSASAVIFGFLCLRGSDVNR